MVSHKFLSALPLAPAFPLFSLVFLVLLSACTTRNEPVIAPPPGESKTAVVRTDVSYTLSIEAQNLTLDRVDTVSWQPAFAWYALALANSGGGGAARVELINHAGTSVWRDSLAGGGTLAEDRGVSVAMPLRLRLSLRNFTGSLACVLSAARCGFSLLEPQLRLLDAAGNIRTSFRTGEEIHFVYSLVISTGQPLTWARGMDNPFGHIRMRQDNTDVRDSWYGYAFPAVPSTGDLAAGDSLVTAWTLPSRTEPSPLPAGRYVAVATPAFAVHPGEMVSGEAVEFSILP